MDIAMTIVHVLACFFLIGVVLLQTGKGADAGAAFGGGSSQSVFGSSGAGNLLTRLTTGTAILFMVSSLGLTWLSTRSLTASVTDVLPSEPAPLAQPIDALPINVAPQPDSIEAASVAANTATEAKPAADPTTASGSEADTPDAEVASEPSS